MKKPKKCFKADKKVYSKEFWQLQNKTKNNLSNSIGKLNSNKSYNIKTKFNHNRNKSYK